MATVHLSAGSNCKCVHWVLGQTLHMSDLDNCHLRSFWINVLRTTPPQALGMRFSHDYSLTHFLDKLHYQGLFIRTKQSWLLLVLITTYHHYFRQWVMQSGSRQLHPSKEQLLWSWVWKPSSSMDAANQTTLKQCSKQVLQVQKATLSLWIWLTGLHKNKDYRNICVRNSLQRFDIWNVSKSIRWVMSEELFKFCTWLVKVDNISKNSQRLSVHILSIVWTQMYCISDSLESVPIRLCSVGLAFRTQLDTADMPGPKNKYARYATKLLCWRRISFLFSGVGVFQIKANVRPNGHIWSTPGMMSNVSELGLDIV